MPGLARDRPALVAACSVAGAAVLLGPALAGGADTIAGDGYETALRNWTALEQSLSSATLPAVDPFECDGVRPIWTDLGAQVFHPLAWLLVFVLGPVLGLKLFVLGHVAACLAGCWAYARRYGELGRAGSAMVATTFTGSGFFAWHVGAEDPAFTAFLLVPALLWAGRRMVDVRVHVVSFALLLTAMIYAGGSYSLLLAAPLVVFDVAHARGQSKIVLLGAGLSVAALLTAPRWLPGLAHTATLPEHTTDVLSVDFLLPMLTLPDLRAPGLMYEWSQCSLYVGWLALALATLGLLAPFGGKLRAGRRWRWQWHVGALLFASLTLGELGPWTPLSWLRSLPLFEHASAPSHFGGGLLFFVALFAGLAVDWLASVLKRSPMVTRLVPWVPVLVIATDVADVHRSIVRQAWFEGSVQLAEPRTPEQIAPNRSPDDFGASRCLAAPVDRRWPLGPSEVRFLEGPGVGDLQTRSANGATARVRVEAPGWAVVGLRDDGGWVREDGRRVDGSGGFVALRTAPETTGIEVLRTTPGLVRSGVSGALGLVLGVALWLGLRRRRLHWSPTRLLGSVAVLGIVGLPLTGLGSATASGPRPELRVNERDGDESARFEARVVPATDVHGVRLHTDGSPRTVAITMGSLGGGQRTVLATTRSTGRTLVPIDAPDAAWLEVEPESPGVADTGILGVEVVTTPVVVEVRGADAWWEARLWPPRSVDALELAPPPGSSHTEVEATAFRGAELIESATARVPRGATSIIPLRAVLVDRVRIACAAGGLAGTRVGIRDGVHREMPLALASSHDVDRRGLARAGSLVLDGDPRTEWWADPTSVSWVDVHLGRQRELLDVELLNARGSRATRIVGVTAWDAAGHRTARTEVRFAPRTTTHEWVSVPELSGVPAASLRIAPRAHFHRGPGLAEVRVTTRESSP